MIVAGYIDSRAVSGRRKAALGNWIRGTIQERMRFIQCPFTFPGGCLGYREYF
jgi:hypothetical protein